MEWQLQMKTQGRLGEQRVQLLEIAGMEWGIMDDVWEECFDSFVSFRCGSGPTWLQRFGLAATVDAVKCRRCAL